MTYQPALVIQGDGSPAQWDNCAAATGATILDRDTRGALRSTGARIRQLTGVSYGGLTLDQIDRALLKGYGPRDHLDVRPKIDFDEMIAHIRAGQGVELFYSYRPLVGTPYDCFSGRFSGIHASEINELDPTLTKFKWGDPGADGRRAGIPKGFQWIPVSLVRSAAGLYVGSGYAQLGFSRDTEPAYLVRLAAGTRFLQYFLDANGRMTSHRYRTTAGGFHANSTVPKLRYWSAAVQARRKELGLAPLSARSLVKLTSGNRSGWYISSKYARLIPGTGG